MTDRRHHPASGKPLPALTPRRRTRAMRGSIGASVAMLVAGLAVGAAATALVLKRPAAAKADAAASASGAAPTLGAYPSAAASAPVSAAAPGEAAIRETLAARLPEFPKIDQITPTPLAGLYEVRIGTELLYADERGRYLLEGNLVDTASRENLTQSRIEKLTAIDFAALPLKDAIVWKVGNGSRKVAVFADPHCGYCKRFEGELSSARDVTVYTFLMPILGPDSDVKSRNIWCAKDRTATWRGWMVEGKTPAAASASCDTEAIQRNLALGRKHKVNGTPAIVFEDGKRVPGAMSLDAFEQQLTASARARKS